MTITHQLQRNRNCIAPHYKAFTLIEVLVVISIITILITLAAIGIGNLSAGKGTAAAIATSESLFEEARNIAVSKGCKSRVLIDIDDPTDDRYLRRIVIVHQRIGDDGEPVDNEWVLANRGYVMPQGTYFSQDFSTPDSAPFSLTATGNISSDFAGQYASYEFNSEGIFLQAGAKFILATGVRGKNQQKPKVMKSAERDFAGFTIWRNGRTSSFRSTAQMGIPDGTTLF